MTTKTDDYARQPVADTLKQLEVAADQGLSAAQPRERLERFGANEIQEREEPLWHRVFRRFWGPIPWMIEAAAILSAVVQKWDDFAIISVMLLVNAGLIWAYALAWVVFNDFVKIWSLRLVRARDGR